MRTFTSDILEVFQPGHHLVGQADSGPLGRRVGHRDRDTINRQKQLGGRTEPLNQSALTGAGRCERSQPGDDRTAVCH